MASTATLQNNFRLRIFLIVVLSIAVRVARPFASSSVIKATRLLEINYIIYGLLMICSLLPFKASWVFSFIACAIAVSIGGFAVGLGTMSTYRCISSMHAGCIQTAPGSIIALFFASVNVLLNMYQAWSVYLIVRYPSFISSAPQRFRIFFSWALPFAWLVNIVLIVESQWTSFVVLHLVADPTMIFLANSGEKWLLVVIAIALLISDAFALIFITNSLARSAVFIQILLTLGASLLLLAPSTETDESDETDETSEPESSEPAIDTTIDPNNKLRLRLQKSNTVKIAF